jgi:predicted negative regulator of RcsB-dependent stress response
MVRAVSVVVAVAVLLGVGWYFGHRPVADLGKRLDAMQADFQEQKADLEARVRQAEARQALWAAHADLLLAAQDVSQHNFGTASERLDRAHDRITRALATPGFTLDLARVSTQVESALKGVASLDPGAAEILTQAAGELYLLLEKAGQA